MSIPTWVRGTIATAVLVAVFAIGASASAQDDPERSALARSLFQEGVELARTERFEEAADRFRRAYEIRQAPAIAFNLASALARLGRVVESSEVLQQVLRAPDVTADLRAAAELQLSELAPRLARVTVRTTGDLDDVRLQLDERDLPAAAIGVAVPIDPGAHVARALRDDREIAREELEVAEGQSVELTLAIPARSAPAEALRVDPDPAPMGGAPPSDDSGIWIGVGVGIAAVVIAGVVVSAVLLSAPGAPAAIPGNTNPAVLEW